MRFLVLLREPDHYARWDAADEAERERAFAAYRAFSAAVKRRGSIVHGEALEHPDTARIVRAATGPGEPRLVVDGPYAETVEQLGGFYVIDVPDLEAAVELTRLLPQDYTLEVRPVLDVDVS